jgi:hypothetical protein
MSEQGEAMPDAAVPAPPDGDYAIVEIMGHRTLVGRVSEVERFGTKLMSIEPMFQSQLLEAVLIGGGSIYQFTPCSKAVAIERQPKRDYELPPAVLAALPPSMLPPPQVQASFLYMDADEGDDANDRGPF